MIIGFGSLSASTPYLGLILLGIVGLWIFAAKDLDWRFAEAQEEMARNAAAESQDGGDAPAPAAAETKPASA